MQCTELLRENDLRLREVGPQRERLTGHHKTGLALFQLQVNQRLQHQYLEVVHIVHLLLDAHLALRVEERLVQLLVVSLRAVLLVQLQSLHQQGVVVVARICVLHQAQVVAQFTDELVVRLAGEVRVGQVCFGEGEVHVLLDDHAVLQFVFGRVEFLLFAEFFGVASEERLVHFAVFLVFQKLVLVIDAPILLVELFDQRVEGVHFGVQLVRAVFEHVLLEFALEFAH